MTNIFSLLAFFTISVALFIASWGNGVVTNEVLAVKEGPACNSFDNRNNPIKDVGPSSSLFPYAEECQSNGTLCNYGTVTEENALNLRENYLAECAKQNQ